jgi:membrane protein implicated in regulation of membrane protease activity
MSQAWVIWLIAAAIFIAAEVFTPGFFLLWFGVGALVAAVMALLGVGGFVSQMLVFLAISVALVIASRTIFEKFFTRQLNSNQLRSGVETMIGQIGTVVEPSQGARNEGAVRVYGSVWTAFPEEGERPLKEGDTVAVERIVGNAIYVRRTPPRPPRSFTETAEP